MLFRSVKIFFDSNELVLNENSKNRIFTDYTSDASSTNYGLGWHIWSNNQARHSGSQPGARNELWIKYDSGNAVVILSNTNDIGSSPVSTLRTNLINLFELD